MGPMIVEITDEYIKHPLGKEDHVFRGKHNAIKWINKTDTDVTVHFGGARPIGPKDIPVPGLGEAGPFDLDPEMKIAPEEVKKYPYDLLVKAKDSVMAADPTVIVHGT
jgi:hypothetical protein